MDPVTSSHVPKGRRWSLRLAIAVSILLPTALGAGAPAWGAGAKSPHRIIFDPAATPSWTQEIHGPGASPDAAFDVQMAKGGVTYVAGMFGDEDASLTKLVDGVPAWPSPKTYDSPNHGPDIAMKMALGPAGSVYTAGMSVGTNGMFDILVLKWSASGALKWARRYDGPAHGHDEPSAVVVDSSGNVTVAGASVAGATVSWVVVSWSASGARRWTSRYAAGAGAQIFPAGLVLAGDGGVYASGGSSNATSSVALTVRYSPTGKTLWKRAYSGPEGLGAMTSAAAARPGGGVIVCGKAVSAATGMDGLVVSYTPQGRRDVFTLDTGPGGASEQRFNDLAVASTRQVVAVGSSMSGGNRDCHAVTYSTDGTIVSKATLPGAWDDDFQAVATDDFGGFYATGTYHTLANRTAILTVRGSVLTGGGGWSSLWGPALATEDNYPTAIAVRGSTACVAGQYAWNPAQGLDQIVLGYVY
ncbi:MAG: hypothetical protein NTX16_11625 [Actinobacteria bacterium]|nr:hypothetical protein [Actinomycetota bacterium]